MKIGVPRLTRGGCLGVHQIWRLCLGPLECQVDRYFLLLSVAFSEESGFVYLLSFRDCHSVSKFYVITISRFKSIANILLSVVIDVLQLQE